MIVNGKSLLAASPIVGMLDRKEKAHGVTYGLSEAGYDIRIKQGVRFFTDEKPEIYVWDRTYYVIKPGRFTIASAIEEFIMPSNLVGIVHDKSTWARRGLSVFNTVLEPGWNGFLTLELVYHGSEELEIPAGSGIAQVVFHETTDRMNYTGRYQGQPDMPVAAKRAE
jgi:dCTP deaminase